MSVHMCMCLHICGHAHVCVCGSGTVQDECKDITVYKLESLGSFKIDKPGFPIKG